MKKAFIRALLLLGLMLAVSMLLMRENPEQIIAVLRHLRWTDIFLLLMMSIWVTVLQGIIFWKIIRLNGHLYSLKDALQNVFICSFISGIFSTTFGKAAQFMLLKSKNISWETTCHVGLVDQIIYYIADISVCGICIFSYRHFFRQTLPELWWIAVAGLAITVCIFAGLLILYIPPVNKAVLKLTDRLLSRIKPNGKLEKLIGILRSFVLEVKMSIANQRNVFKYIGVIGLNMVKVLIRNGLMFVVIFILNDQVRIVDFPIYFACACFLEMALSALPVYGDKGTAEIGFVLVFGVLIGQVSATSAMLVWRFFSFYMNAAIGAIVLGLSPQIHLKEILHSENEQK